MNVNSLPYLSTQGNTAVDALIDRGGITLWRVIVESTRDWETTNDNADPASSNWSYYNALYETPKFQALWALLDKLKQRNAASIMLNVMGNVPPWMGGTSIDTSAEDEWVEMIVSLVYYARVTKGLRIDALAPLNEQDWGRNEGPLVSSGQYVRLMKKVWARLDSLGLGEIRAVGPDNAQNSAATSDYMPAIIADSGLMARVDRFALHSYSGESGGAAALIANSAYPNRGFWMTEFSAGCSGCDSGSQPTNDWDFSRGTFLYALDHMRDGAAATFVYDAYDSFYEHHGAMGYWGMLELNQTTGAYTARKRMHAISHLARFIRPGARRIGLNTTVAGLRAQAYMNPDGSVTVAGINTGSTSSSVQGALQGLPSAPTSLRVFLTTRSSNMAVAADAAVSGGAFTVLIPADAIFTLTSSP